MLSRRQVLFSSLLAALLPWFKPKVKYGVQQIKISDLWSGDNRTFYGSLHWVLRDSVAKHGVINPITVMPNGDGHYLILDGYHRYMSARSLGHESVLCNVVPALSKEDIKVLRKCYSVSYTRVLG